MALGSIQQLPHHQPHQKMLSSSGHSRLQQHLRPIAPASTSGVTTSTVSSSYMSPNRSYMPYSKLNKASVSTLDSNHPSVVRRNARERNRVKQVNNGFLNLRQHIPQAIIADLSNGKRGGTGPGANKKLSKVNTLRMALEYIRLLQSVIDEVDQSDTSSVSSYSSSTSTSASLTGSSFASTTPGSGNTAAAIELPQNAAHMLRREQKPLPIQQHSAYYQYNFTDSINRHQQQPQQQQHLLQQQLISPAASTNSSICSETSVSSDSSWSALFSNNNNDNNSDQHQADHLNNLSPTSPPSASSPIIRFKFEPKMYGEYQAGTASDDEELLDYISLWQDDM